MKKLALLPLVLLLSACETTGEQVVVQTKLEVVMPDNSLFYCPQTKYPDYKNLTDEEVAKLLLQMHKNNRACRNSNLAVKRYLEESKKIIEEEQAN